MSRPAFSFCVCADSRLLQTRLDALISAHPPEGGGAWQRHVFWADEGLSGSFWEHLTLQGLFAVPKALVLRRAESIPADILNKQLSPALLPLAAQATTPSLSPVWTFLCLETGFDKGKPKIAPHIQRLPAFQEAEKRGWLDITPPLAGKTLAAFIRSEASRQGLALKDSELAMLLGALPPDASHIASELGKLALAAGPDGRLPQDAALLLDAANELSIFELMRLVQQNRQSQDAWRQILEDRLSGENSVFAFIAILLREARTLWQSLCGGAPHLPGQLAMQKKMAAQSLGLPGIAKIWELALQADKGIKSGERNPDQTFEILAAELFLLFGGKKSR